MKLLRELETATPLIVESEQDPQKKNYYITGIFMQSEVQNRNKRIYPRVILEKQVNFYNDNYVKKNRAFGEFGHPETPKINENLISHRIVELKWNGNDVFGKALVHSTPMGKIVRTIMEEGGELGVSSRALGSVQNGIVQENLLLKTVDVVTDPSAPEAFVTGLMENVEWICENGVWLPKEIDDMKNVVENNAKLNEEEIFIKIKEFLIRINIIKNIKEDF